MYLLRTTTLAACALVIVGLFVLGSSRELLADANATVQGDVNCDAAVNTIDGLQVLRSIAGLDAVADCMAEGGDTNCDGAVNTIDILRILRFVAGLPNQTPQGCPDPGGPPTEQPTSEELIADALAGGDIDYETSLLYRAYALYGDTRLPAEYQSPVVDLHAGGPLFNEIFANESSLSTQVLEELTPFTSRPNDPSSAFSSTDARLGAAGAPAWISASAAAGAARVWVQDGPGAQTALADYAARVTEVWDPTTALMRPPNPDQAGIPSVEINPDSAIDFYFVNVGALDPRLDCTVDPEPCRFDQGMDGYARAQPPNNGNASSAWVLVDRNIESDRLVSDLIHEIFHTMQYTYDFAEGFWLFDSTATWASFRVLGQLGHNRTPVHDFLPDFFSTLDHTLTRDNDMNRYASWLYFLYAEMERGPDFVRKVIERAAAPGQQDDTAVDAEFPFSDAFHGFALRNWNQAPVEPRYESVDQTFPALAPPLQYAEQMVTVEHGPYHLDARIRPLAAHYYRFTFAGDALQSVTLNNPVDPAGNVRVQAIRKVGDAWQEPEDWTNEESMHLCRNIQDVTELVVVLSNASTSAVAPGGQNPTLVGHSVGCTAWEGSASVVEINSSGVVFKAEVTNLRFELAEDQGTQNRYVSYDLVESSPVDWTASGTRFGCAVSGEMHVGPADGTVTDAVVYGSLVLDLMENDYEGNITGFDSEATYTVTCPPPVPPSQLSFGSPPIWFPYLIESPVLGPVLSGDVVNDAISGLTRHMIWRFTPAP